MLPIFLLLASLFASATFAYAETSAIAQDYSAQFPAALLEEFKQAVAIPQSDTSFDAMAHWKLALCNSSSTETVSQVGQACGACTVASPNWDGDFQYYSQDAAGICSLQKSEISFQAHTPAAFNQLKMIVDYSMGAGTPILSTSRAEVGLKESTVGWNWSRSDQRVALFFTKDEEIGRSLPVVRMIWVKGLMSSMGTDSMMEPIPPPTSGASIKRHSRLAAPSPRTPNARFYDLSCAKPSAKNPGLAAVEESDICVENLKGGDDSGSGPLAQSFIPHCGHISGIDLKIVSGPSDYGGWLRLDLAKDSSDSPGTVLSRVWLKLEPNCSFGEGAYVTFPTGDLTLNADARYWFTVLSSSEISENGAMRFEHRLGESTIGSYPEGKLLVGADGDAWPNISANFRVLGKFESMPAGLHALHGTRPPKWMRTFTFGIPQSGDDRKIFFGLLADDYYTRQRAQRQMESLGPNARERLVRKLIPYLKSDVVLVRQLVAEELAKLIPEAEIASTEAVEAYRDTSRPNGSLLRLIGALGPLVKDAVPDLIKRLGTYDQGTARFAAGTLILIQDPDGIKAANEYLAANPASNNEEAQKPKVNKPLNLTAGCQSLSVVSEKLRARIHDPDHMGGFDVFPGIPAVACMEQAKCLSLTRAEIVALNGADVNAPDGAETFGFFPCRPPDEADVVSSPVTATPAKPRPRLFSRSFEDVLDVIRSSQTFAAIKTRFRSCEQVPEGFHPRVGKLCGRCSSWNGMPSWNGKTLDGNFYFYPSRSGGDCTVQKADFGFRDSSIVSFDDATKTLEASLGEPKLMAGASERLAAGAESGGSGWRWDHRGSRVYLFHDSNTLMEGKKARLRFLWLKNPLLGAGRFRDPERPSPPIAPIPRVELPPRDPRLPPQRVHFDKLLGDLLGADDIKRSSAARAMSHLTVENREAVAQRLLGRLDGAEQEEKSRVLKALAVLGPDAKATVPALRKMMTQDGRGDVDALAVLAAIGPDAESAVPDMLMLMIQGPSAEAMPSLLDAFDRIGDPVGVDAAEEYRELHPALDLKIKVRRSRPSKDNTESTASEYEWTENLTPDELPPVSRLGVFHGREFTGDDGAMYVASGTSLFIATYDPVRRGAYSSGVAFSGYTVDNQPRSYSDLTRLAHASSFTLPSGSHIVVFGSIDLAGNEEPFKSIKVLVTDPLPVPTGLLNDTAKPYLSMARQWAQEWAYDAGLVSAKNQMEVEKLGKGCAANPAGLGWEFTFYSPIKAAALFLVGCQGKLLPVPGDSANYEAPPALISGKFLDSDEAARRANVAAEQKWNRICPLFLQLKTLPAEQDSRPKVVWNATFNCAQDNLTGDILLDARTGEVLSTSDLGIAAEDEDGD